MDNPLSKILIDFTNEYNLPNNKIQPVIQKLNEEFYIRIKDMKHLSFQKWKEFKLPENLYNILKDKYDEYLKIESKPKIIKKTQKKKPFRNLNKIGECSFSIGIGMKKFKQVIEQVSNLKVNLEDLKKNLTNLENQIKDNIIIQNIYQYLDDTINNILHFPNEDNKKINYEELLKQYPYNILSDVFSTLKFIKIPDTEYIRFTNNETFLLEPYNLIVDRRKQFNEKKVNINININQNNNQNTNLENKEEVNENEKNKNEENKIEENKNEGKKPILLKKNVFFQTENPIIGTSNINPDLIENNNDNLNKDLTSLNNEEKSNVGIKIKAVVNASNLIPGEKTLPKSSVDENTNSGDNNNIHHNIKIKSKNPDLNTSNHINNNEHLTNSNDTNKINESQNYNNTNQNNQFYNINNQNNQLNPDNNSQYNYNINIGQYLNNNQINYNYQNNNRLIYSNRAPSNINNLSSSQNNNSGNQLFPNFNISKSIIINQNYDNNINQFSNFQMGNNNYKSQIINKPNVFYEEKSIPELLIDENSRRNKIILNAKINHNPRCFFLTNMKNIEKLIQKYSFKHIYKENDRNYIDFITQIINNQTNEYNKIESNNLKTLIESPIIIQGDIFFIFPNRYILKGCFCLYEKVKDLYDFVLYYLNNKKDQFILYFNNNKIDLINTDIMMLNLSFPISLKVNFLGKSHGLIENELNKLTVNVF